MLKKFLRFTFNGKSSNSREAGNNDAMLIKISYFWHTILSSRFRIHATFSTFRIILQIIKQINAMSSNIARIKKSIVDKEGYMALAHTRLGHRCQRPGMELTQDLVEANLVKEIHELRNVVANLQQMLCEVCRVPRVL